MPSSRSRYQMLARHYARWLHLLRASQGCCWCGTHEGRLTHHHVDPDTKSANIGRMWGASLERWMDEIDKCVVLCWPCHKAVHDQLRNRDGTFANINGYTGEPKA